MKRFWLSLTFSTLSLLALTAQSSLFIGGTGGVNLSRFQHTQDLQELYTSGSTVFGFNGGLKAGIVLQDWTITTGLQYIQKGAEYRTDNFDTGGSTGYFSAREKLHYLSVPLLLGYRYEMLPGVAFSIDIGPSFNFGLGGKLDETTEYFGSEDIQEEHYDVHFGTGINDDYRPMQVGFQVSPGLAIDLNRRNKLTFNVTWDVGTADAFNPRYKQANDFFDDYRGSQLNRSVLFSIGYEHHLSVGDKY